MIWQRFQEYDELRHARGRPPHRDPPVPGQWLPPGTGLIVEHEIAELTYADGALPLRGPAGALQRRHRAGHPLPGPDRRRPLPGRPGRLQPAPPRAPADLRRAAPARRTGRRRRGEPMQWRAKHDRDAFKEVWLLFENERRAFPLYPGERATIEYAYTRRRGEVGALVPAGGPAAHPAPHRPARLPGRRSTRRSGASRPRCRPRWPAAYPARAARRGRPGGLRLVDRRPAAERPLPARSGGSAARRAGRRADGAPGAPAPAAAPASGCAASASCSAAPTCCASRPGTFDLPREEAAARDVVDRAARRAGPARRAARLQQGRRAGRAAARPRLGRRRGPPARPRRRAGRPAQPAGRRRVAPSTDEQYEGCLSFFDYRGLVPRPLRIDVEHARFDGTRVITSFERAMARLVAHEIDHLEGRLYVDRMAPSRTWCRSRSTARPGRPWRY